MGKTFILAVHVFPGNSSNSVVFVVVLVPDKDLQISHVSFTLSACQPVDL